MITEVSVTVPTWECPVCGALVSNQVVHDAWHNQLRGAVLKLAVEAGLSDRGRLVVRL